jgi:hypothetical protein
MYFSAVPIRRPEEGFRLRGVTGLLGLAELNNELEKTPYSTRSRHRSDLRRLLSIY